MQHDLEGPWSIGLPDDGVGSPDESGDLVVQCSFATIVVSQFVAEDGFSPEDALRELKESSRPAPRAEFDEYGPDGTLRWACLIDEPDEENHQVGLFGYVIGHDSWVQVAVLYSDPHDHDQAIGIWRSVTRSNAA